MTYTNNLTSQLLFYLALAAPSKLRRLFDELHFVHCQDIRQLDVIGPNLTSFDVYDVTQKECAIHGMRWGFSNAIRGKWYRVHDTDWIFIRYTQILYLKLYMIKQYNSNSNIINMIIVYETDIISSVHNHKLLCWCKN